MTYHGDYYLSLLNLIFFSFIEIKKKFLKKSLQKVTDKSNRIAIDITGIEWVLEVKKISFFLAVKIKWQKNNSNFHLEF